MKVKERFLRTAFGYKSVLEAYAFAVLRDWNLAEDAVQEVFIQVNLKWREIDEDRLLNWMKTLTRNKAVDILRKRKRAVYNDNLINLVDNCFEEHLDDDVSSLSQERRYHLQNCMKKISSLGRQALLGFYRDGKSTDQLGKELKRSANSVRILLHRTRDSLRRCINLGIEAEQ